MLSAGKKQRVVQARCRPAAFLDRDGVINVDTGYPHRPEQLVFTPTAVEAIAELNRAGYLIVVVTNQSGVARGLFDLTDVAAFHAEMTRRLAAKGAWIDAFYVAPFHPDGVVPAFSIEHNDRKPGAGMLTRAMQDLQINRHESFLIGDKTSDLEAAQRAGIKGFLVTPDRCDLATTVLSILAGRKLAEDDERAPTGIDG